jgi:hypothetical protein
MMATKRTKIKYDKLKKFGNKHYYYINQIFGDLTLREIIMEQFPRKRWRLASQRYPGYGHHHVCKRKGKRYDSIDSGLQSPVHPTDVLCQSYRVLFYLGALNSKERLLTKEIQFKMIKMWKIILKNKIIKEQIEFTASEGKVWQNINRGKNIIKKIKEVLNEWKKYGYKWFMLHEHEIEESDLKYLRYES